MRAAAIGTVLIAAVSIVGTPVRADDYRSCMKAADGIDPALFACQGQELERRNRALNAIYATLLAKLTTDPVTTAKLKTAERAWIAFRDADCAVLDYGPDDGTLGRMVRTDCIIDKTRTRIAELEALGKSPDLNKRE